MSKVASAAAAGLQAEIRDLTGYLEGLPSELRSGGAFSAYEARLEDLKRSLASATLQELRLPGEALLQLVDLLRGELELVASLSPAERIEPARAEELSRRILALLSDFPTAERPERRAAG